ncbi:MAG: hypothetical protein WCK70_16930 [Chloroflexales bacterium]|jgi:hypothetical protein
MHHPADDHSAPSRLAPGEHGLSLPRILMRILVNSLLIGMVIGLINRLAVGMSVILVLGTFGLGVSLGLGMSTMPLTTVRPSDGADANPWRRRRDSLVCGVFGGIIRSAGGILGGLSLGLAIPAFTLISRDTPIFLESLLISILSVLSVMLTGGIVRGMVTRPHTDTHGAEWRRAFRGQRVRDTLVSGVIGGLGGGVGGLLGAMVGWDPGGLSGGVGGTFAFIMGSLLLREREIEICTAPSRGTHHALSCVWRGSFVGGCVGGLVGYILSRTCGYHVASTPLFLAGLGGGLGVGLSGGLRSTGERTAI